MLTASFIEDVVGVTHNNDDGSSRQEIIWTCKAGERLILEHESDNRHDKHAIRVMRQDRTQVGYLSKEIAKEIYDEFLQIPGWQYSAITLGVHFAYPPDFETLRVGIFLANASEEGQTILARLEEFAAANQQSFDRLLPLIEIPSKLFKAHRKQAARGSPPSFVK